MRIAIAGLAVLGMTTVAGATTLGLRAANTPAVTWDTFVDADGNASPFTTLSFSNASPGITAGTPEYTATLSASMTGGSVTGSGDRLYNGIGGGNAAFNLTINGTALQNIETLYLFVKMTTPDGGTRQNFLNVALNGTPDTTADVYNSGTGETAGGFEQGVIFYGWSGLNILNGQNFSFTITSPASGHVSLDAIQLSTVPEPTALGLVGAAGLMALRRRRQA